MITGNRRFNLGKKFIFLTSSLVLITALVIGLYVIINEERDSYDLLLEHGRSLVVMIAENSESGISSGNLVSLQHMIEMISTYPAIAYIFILDADERLLIYKADDKHPIHIPSMEHTGYWKNKKEVFPVSYYNKEDGKHYINIISPVFSKAGIGYSSIQADSSGKANSNIIGYIHLGISQENIKKRTTSFVYSIIIFTTLIISLGIMITIFVTRKIISPINDLSNATREIAEGKLDRQIDIDTNDEVSDLAQAFNHMRESLQVSHAKVERQTTDLTVALNRMKQEITERERTERALKDSEKKYRMIFEESKDVIFICSFEGIFLEINHAGTDLFGYPSADALRAADPRKDLYDDPDEHDILQKMLERQGFVKDHEIRMKRSDGEKLTVLITASIIRDENGFISAYRGVFHDVTEKRQLELQLLQAQKMEAIGQLAGGIAHDFNNILTAIMGYGNLLLLDMPDNSPLRDHAEHILSSSERAANLTRSLLSFSRKQVISPKPVNLNGIVVTIEKLLIRLIGEDIELRTVLDDSDVMVLADSGQIEQVLINLCTNARDAMAKGGVLTIAISTMVVRHSAKPGPYAVITISDTGTGIDEEIKEKIFEPFFTTKETGKGTGLGLSIVYGIIKQHNGYVNMTSQPGKGTIFKLFIPMVDFSVVTFDEKISPLIKGGTETVLVAEDDTEVRKLIRLVLTGNGYKVIEAVDGQDALGLLNRHPGNIQLLLLDVIMPKKNGKEVYEVLKLSEPDVKVIFMSGYTADIIDKKGIIAENLNFISKPIAPHELLSKVREVLDHGRETSGLQDLSDMKI